MDPIEKGEVDPANMKLQKAVQGAACEMTPEEFEEIIQERKADRKRKAEEKRLEGMRRIAEMKSKDGIDPLAQFPKEIWLMILEIVTPADRANMYHLHPLFSDLLEENKIGDFFLPLALDRKIPFVESLVRNDGGQLNMKRLLELRLVSKAARENIDKWIEDDIVNSMKNSWFTPRFEPIRIDDMTKLNRMLELLSDGPSKRFPKRAIQIEISPWCTSNMSRPSFPQVVLPEFEDEDDSDEKNDEQDENELAEGGLFRRDFANFHAKMKMLLEKIGHDILYFQLDLMSLDELDELGVSFRRIYFALGDYFKLMPSMKWLDIKIAWFDRGAFLQPNWMDDARAITQNDPFPKVDGLERVHFWGWKEYPLWDAILISNPHLKYHTHREKNTSWEYELVRFTEPSVLSLSLETLNAREDCASWDMPMLQKISDSNWRLRKMSLEMRGKLEPVEMGDVLGCLQKFPTLEDISLSINKVNVGYGIDFLMLPNLRKFEIALRSMTMMIWTEGFKNFYSLHFLLQCAKLESLTWDALPNHTQIIHREMLEQEANDGQIVFKGGWADLSRSNVWEVFPCLSCVEVILWERNGLRCTPYKRKYFNRKLVYQD